MKETQDKWERMRKRASDLCTEVGQEYPRSGFHVGDGWFPHVAKALREIAKVGVPWQLAQVKQKFCQLRIYVMEGDLVVAHPVIGYAVRDAAEPGVEVRR